MHVTGARINSRRFFDDTHEGGAHRANGRGLF